MVSVIMPSQGLRLSLSFSYSSGSSKVIDRKWSGSWCGWVSWCLLVVGSADNQSTTSTNSHLRFLLLLLVPLPQDEVTLEREKPTIRAHAVISFIFFYSYILLPGNLSGTFIINTRYSDPLMYWKEPLINDCKLKL